MKYKSIGTRIFFSVIPTIILTITIFIFVSYVSSEKNTKKLLDEKMQQNLYTANLEIQIEIQKNADITESIAIYAGTIADIYSDEKFHDDNEIQSFITNMLSSNSNTIDTGIYFEPNKYSDAMLYDSYFAYQNEQKEIKVINDYSEYIDYLEKEWYVKAKEAKGELVWSIIYFDPVVNTYMISASKAFYDSGGTFCGVAVASMALDDVQNIVNKISIDKTGKAFIISKMGRYITFYDSFRDINNTIGEEKTAGWFELGKIIKEKKSGKTTFIDAGTEKIAYFMTMEDVSWTLIILYDMEEINLNKNIEFMTTIIIPMVGLLFILFGIFLVTRYLRKIIMKVNDFSNLAAAGNFTKQIEITETDEFGIMEENLNQMISNMNDMNNNSIRLLEEAQAANIAKSDFLSRMSHEIRTPMTAIIGMTKIAHSTEDINRIKDCLGKIDNASRHLLNLINDILDMSKIEANKLELNYENFNLVDCIHNIYNVIHIKAEEKSQKISINIDENVPIHIIGDGLRMTQVFTNLIGNAIKFTPEDGIITVDIKETQRDETHSIIEASITDNGIGISKEQQKKLFKSFEQADGTISRKFGGSGLGLVICKRMVELMGGTIWVESEGGKGSRFIFNIKAERGSDIRKKDVKQTRINNRENSRILAVDDSEESIEYLNYILKSFSLSSEAAVNGMEAIQMVEQSIKENNPYNVIFMDYYMPGLNGIETAKKIREISDGSVSIIMVSISDWKDIEAEAKGAGVTKHITKPISPSSILDTIQNVINDPTKLNFDRMDFSNRDFSSYHILLAEDNEINTEIVQGLLEDTKINIEVAENGRIVCEKFEKNPDKYDLIFMDIQMPEMDGYEATRKIRQMKIKKAQTIPIIAMTANAFKEDFDKCIEAGMVDHISKPIDSEILLIKMNDYLFMRNYLNKDIF